MPRKENKYKLETTLVQGPALHFPLRLHSSGKKKFSSPLLDLSPGSVTIKLRKGRWMAAKAHDFY